MPSKKTTKRSAPISYRPPRGLEGELLARHLKSGLSMNAFITEAIFSKSSPRQVRRPSVEKEELARLLVLAAKIHDALVAHDLTGIEREQALEDLSVLRGAIFSALGFKS